MDDEGVDGRILLKRMLKNWEGSMECVELAQDKEKLAGFCACGREIIVSKNVRNFLTS